jgi:hypothetical protein
MTELESTPDTAVSVNGVSSLTGVTADFGMPLKDLYRLGVRFYKGQYIQ